MSCNAFVDKMDVVYDILDREFPKTSTVSAVYGSITNMCDFISRTELEPLLYAIKESSRTGVEYYISDEETNNALQMIYRMIEHR